MTVRPAKVHVDVHEMIGRTGEDPLLVAVRNQYQGVTVDNTRPDYKWWDGLRRGKNPGYELGALFSDPIAAIMADWTLGKGLTIRTEDEYTDKALDEFIEEYLDDLIEWDYTSTSLGDGYIGVNPDGTLVTMSPDTVLKTVNRMDYRDVLSYTVTTQPDNEMTIVDLYEKFGHGVMRTLTVKTEDGDVSDTFVLPLDHLPIIHIANRPGTNEVYGRPEVEALRKLFAEYHDVLTKSLDGVKMMGHAIPVVSGSKNPQQDLKNNQTGTVDIELADGSIETVPVIDLAKIFMLILGEGSNFDFAQPGAFTQDAGRLLEFLFLLMLQRSRIPEWVWGGAVASSKASVDAQGPAFDLFIKSRQRKFARALKRMVRVWLRYRSLVDPRIKADLPLSVMWPDVMPANEALRLEWAKAALEKGALSREAFLRLSDLVDDPKAEILRADEESQDRQSREEQAIQREIERMAAQRETTNPEGQDSNSQNDQAQAEEKAA